jgi:hypothetical protein
VQPRGEQGLQHGSSPQHIYATLDAIYTNLKKEIMHHSATNGVAYARVWNQTLGYNEIKFN